MEYHLAACRDEARLCTMICDWISSILKQIHQLHLRHQGRSQEAQWDLLATSQLISDISKETSVVIDTVNNGISAIRRKFGWKKVLIVLDDIDDTKQLDALVGDQVHVKREHVFGAGSKIIITTRNRAPLIAHGLEIYYPKELKYPQSLKLFSLHAFKVSPPTSEFIGLSEKVVKVAGGLPLALKKYVFLDVACFLIGSSKEEALFFWEDHYAADSAINALESKSLLTMDVDNRFRMHG
ncbi:disease resistance protein RUN1-like [Nymphaea colorata]|uniref:disease resistance protein RUN1-like n=1 Tax=Nymphaea colorata TaxID=210225 RepID=UPI00214E9B7C|nr:disease resistance protein RUN1-like [Nymphaea colorata]